MVVVSARHVGGSRGSGIVSSAADVLYQSSENRGSVGRVSVFGLRWCMWGEGWRLDQGLEWWGGVMYV